MTHLENINSTERDLNMQAAGVPLDRYLNVPNLHFQVRDKLESDILKAARLYLQIPDRDLIHTPKLRAVITNDPALQKYFTHRGSEKIFSEMKSV